MKPGVNIHIGPDLASLARHFAEIRRAPVRHVLEPEWTIVPSAPVRQWLDWNLASCEGRRDGITANIVSLFPDEFLRLIGTAVLGASYVSWDIHALTLALLAATPHGTYVDARRYAEGLDELLRWRPEDLERGTAPDDFLAHYQSLGSSSTLPLEQRRRILAAAQSAALEGVPQRLFIFGFPSTPGDASLLSVLEALGHHHEIHAFVPAPLGHGGDFGPWHRESEEALELWRNLSTITPNGDHLELSEMPTTQLGSLQRRARGLEYENTPPSVEDASLTIVGCVGASRQAEMARDLLLDAMQSRSVLPHEILVLSPDLRRFEAPLDRHWNIPASDAGTPLPRLPFELTERWHDRRLTRLGASASLITLLTSYVTVDDIRQWCETPCVRAVMNLSEDEWERLWQIADVSTLTFGISPEHRTTWNLYADDNGAGTWQSAGDTVVAATLWPSTGSGLVSDDYRLVAVLQPLLRTIEEATAWRDSTTRRPLSVWIASLSAAMNALTYDPSDDTWERMVDRIAQWNAAGLDPVIRAQDLVQWWQRIAADTSRQRIFGRVGVTVAPLTALAYAPYRVVCLLGMDEESLPPTALRSAVLGPRRHGDPDPRHTVTGATLAAILSATEELIILFDNREEATGRSIEPALPLATIIAAAPSVDSPHAALVRSSPRHFFDPVDVDAASLPLFDPRGTWTASATTPSVPTSGEHGASYEDLARLLRHPARYHLVVGRGASLPDRVDARRDVPPISLDARERWRLQRFYLDNLVDDFRALLDDKPDAIDISALWHPTQPECASQPCQALHDIVATRRLDVFATPGYTHVIPRRLFERRLQFPLLELCAFNAALDALDVVDGPLVPEILQAGGRALQMRTSSGENAMTIGRSAHDGEPVVVHLEMRPASAAPRVVLPALLDLAIMKILDPSAVPRVETSFLPDKTAPYRRREKNRPKGAYRLNPLRALRFDGTVDDALHALEIISEWQRRALVEPVPLFRRTSVAFAAPALKASPSTEWEGDRGGGEANEIEHMLLFPVSFDELRESGPLASFPEREHLDEMFSCVSLQSSSTSSRRPSRWELEHMDLDISDDLFVPLRGAES